MTNLPANIQSAISLCDYATAEAYVSKLPAGPTKLLCEAEVLRARACDTRFTPETRRESACQALRCLAKCYLLPEASSLSAQERAKLTEGLSWASSKIVQELTGIVFPRTRTAVEQCRQDDLVRAFYLCGATHEKSPGKLALEEKEKLKNELRQRDTVGLADYSIEFFKKYSSYTPLLSNSDPERLGGGYFASLGGYGCVIDPGHHFLDNFFKANRSVFDIDGVIVTHFHDDHYADLSALLSLLHQRGRYTENAEYRKVDLFLDSQTYKIFEPLIQSSKKELGGQRKELHAGQEIEVTGGVILRTLPTFHPIFGMNSGVGLHFEIQPKKSYLTITGDTGWNEEIEAVYTQLRHPQGVLVAHVSTVCVEEVLGALFGDEPGFYSKHLGIRGLGRAIEAIQPAHVVLSEIGEELRDSVKLLAELVTAHFPCTCSIGWPNSPCHFPVCSVKW